ncbi:unnamed protein product [Effrenium voratum]|nr:unnamed protein product [Effrenium voratum]|mmetsp:Transcript_32336/g.77333  ORF Transcript_32336/g.77333 Transcript_32336/m.77333 type:complete len:427 (+) Transcript_32336:69-1349(+)
MYRLILAVLTSAYAEDCVAPLTATASSLLQNLHVAQAETQRVQLKLSMSREMQSSGFLSILVSSLKAIGVAASVIAVGVLATRRGIINLTVRKAMGEITMKLAIPALLFSRILYCDQCNTGGNQCAPCQPFMSIILSSWILFLLPIVVVGLGVLLGKATAMLTCAPKDFASGTICAVAFGNSTGLPIVLLSVISLHTSGASSMGNMDPLLRLPVYLMLYPVLQWGVGRYLLRDESEDPDQPKEACSCWTVLEQALVPPVLAALLGLAVGLSPIRAWMVDVLDQDNDAPLSWLYDGIYKLGDAAVPLNLLILGSALSKGANFEVLPMRVGLAIVFSKLVLLPLCMSIVVYGLIRIGPKDPSLWLVCLIVSCTPTANNVAVMAESGGQNKDAMSTAIFLQYLVAPFCVASSIAYFNWLLSSSWYLPAA